LQLAVPVVTQHPFLVEAVKGEDGVWTCAGNAVLSRIYLQGIYQRDPFGVVNLFRLIGPALWQTTG
jgi:hypothetical protein